MNTSRACRRFRRSRASRGDASLRRFAAAAAAAAAEPPTSRCSTICSGPRRRPVTEACANYCTTETAGDPRVDANCMRCPDTGAGQREGCPDSADPGGFARDRGPSVLPSVKNIIFQVPNFAYHRNPQFNYPTKPILLPPPNKASFKNSKIFNFLETY